MHVRAMSTDELLEAGTRFVRVSAAMMSRWSRRMRGACREAGRRLQAADAAIMLGRVSVAVGATP